MITMPQDLPATSIPKLKKVQKIYVDLLKCTDFGYPGSQRSMAKDYLNHYFESLKQQGFELVHDVDKITNDTILFSPATPETNDACKTNEFQSQVRESLRDEKINILRTVPFNEFFENPFFPAVYKATHFSGGEDKHLVENHEQLDKIKRFFEEVDKEIEDGKKELKIPQEINESHEFEEALGYYKSCVVFQEFAECPSKANTSMRVLMPPNDDILAASLKYNFPENVNRNANRQSPLSTQSQFTHPDSLYFLNGKKIQSNSALGGLDIPLKPLYREFNYSPVEERLLREHNFDPRNADVPHEIKSASAKIAHDFEKQIGILGGHDYILDKKKGWCLLEVNGHRSGPKTFMQAYGLKYKSHASSDIQSFLDMLTLHDSDQNQQITEKTVQGYLHWLESEKFMLMAKDTVLARRVQKEISRS